MTAANWIQTIALMFTIIGLIITIKNNRKQLNIFNDQLKLGFFAEYTKRYQDIILNFPENISESTFDWNKLTDDARNKTLRYMRAYFDLCSEEYDLRQGGYIDDWIWVHWEGGIKYAFSKKAFRDAWRTIRLDTIFYRDFTKWVNELMEGPVQT